MTQHNKILFIWIAGWLGFIFVGMTYEAVRDYRRENKRRNHPSMRKYR